MQADRRITALEQEMRMLRRAHPVRGERIVAERVAFADQVYGLRHEQARLEAELVEARGEAADAHRRADQSITELQGLRRTRTFRYSGPLRRLYGRLRRPLSS